MDHLQTETRNPASLELDKLTALEIVRLMNAEDARVITAVGSQAEAIARAIEVIADRLEAGGRLIYVGAGTSGRLGVLDATECPPTFSAPPEQVVGVIAGGNKALTQAVEGAEDRPELAVADLEALSFAAGDVLVGIATSGRTPYVRGAVEYARRLGAFTIGLSCNTDSDLIPLVDLPITPVVGPEVLTGSTRLKAGTATKLVLNTLTTGAMVRLGKTYGNLMVDLRATNSKLRARTNRIVRQLTGLAHADADALLQSCGGELKTALVAQLARVPADEARRRLEAAGGRVRPALGDVPSDAARVEMVADLVLGIDGGGTRTTALLARRQHDATTVLGRGQGGPSNLQAVGVERALSALDEAIAAAFAQGGLARACVGSACFGLAGAGRAEDQRLIEDWAQRTRIAKDVKVTTDADLLLAAGTPAGWGVAVIAGTGSMALGRTRDGHTARAGGWGPLLGDEGSGYNIVMSALGAAVRAADGRGPATSLLDRLLSAMNLAKPSDLVPAVQGGAWDRAALSALAPVVFESAAAGDVLGDAILAHNARELALAVATVVRALQLDAEPVPLALAGGVLLGHQEYQAMLLDGLHDLGIVAESTSRVDEPAQGALNLALSAASSGNIS
jgi:N-acetylmuramic acid 6-phosphate etherase